METRKARATLVGFCLVLALLAGVFVSRSHAAEQAAPGGAAPAQDAETGLKPDPKLVVQPFPEPEIVLDANVNKRPDFVAQRPTGNGFIFERRDEKGKKIAGVVVPGVVLVTRGLVELFGCGEGGKEHETILRLECDVQSLDLALTSAGLKRGRLPSKADISEANQGSRVLALVQWTGEDGKSVTYRSEDLVVSTRRQSPMPRVGWTYVGAWAEMPDPASPKGEKKHKVLAAANSRSYVTTFRDQSALLDNPLEEAIDDTIFAANYMLLPRSGTPVRVIFRTPTQPELKEIAELEKFLATQPLGNLRHGLHQGEAGTEEKKPEEKKPEEKKK
jgi:hypothetical protein